jgi:hypothetical protein
LLARAEIGLDFTRGINGMALSALFVSETEGGRLTRMKPGKQFGLS